MLEFLVKIRFYWTGQDRKQVRLGEKLGRFIYFCPVYLGIGVWDKKFDLWSLLLLGDAAAHIPGRGEVKSDPIEAMEEVLGQVRAVPVVVRR